MKTSIVSTLVLSLLMVGCGGSGSGSKNTSSASSLSSSTAVSVSSIASSDQASSSAPVLTGVFLDAAVANLGYRTATRQGVTNTNGEFNYLAGELITFFIGGLELPSVIASDIITPMDIADTKSLNDNQLINILRLLQSLDADGDLSNGIEITAAAIAAGVVLDFTVAPDVFAESPAVKALLQASGSVNQELISTEQALAHFQETLAFINGTSSSSSSQTAESSSSATSEDVIAVPGSSVSSASVVSSSSSETVVASSSSSAISEIPAVSSASSTSSIDSGSTGIRPAKMEGFAAYAGVTGGAGGPVITVTTGTELNAALCGVRSSNKTAPVIILVNGTINHGNTTAQGCNTQPDVIEIKQMSNVSIIGVGSNALFDQIGIHVRDASNIIIQNVHIRNVKKSGSPISNGGDAIGMETDVDRVWIDHNWLEASGGEKDGYDSLLDMKSGVTNVTVSYNKFNDSSRAGLVGFNDSDTNNNITFHHNYYKNIEQRTPLVRNALVHVYNNYYSNDNINTMIHGINSRANAKVLVESNYFYNTNNPLIASDDSPTPGCWQTNNDNTVLPTIYYSRTVGNGALVIPEVIDGQLQSTCAVTVPYTVEMDPAASIPEIVMANAGVGKIGNEGEATSSSSANSSEANTSSNESSEQSSSALSVGTAGTLNESFNVDKATLFSATYQSISTDPSAARYFVTGGNSGITVTNNELTISAGRFTIGHRPPRTNTLASDTSANGDFDLSRPYRISFNVVATSGTGKLQVYVDNNTTSVANSMHGGSSRVFDAAVNTLTAGQLIEITPTVGTATSFIAFRTESSTSVTIDNLKLEYLDEGSSESSESSAGGAVSSSSSSVSSEDVSSGSSMVSSEAESSAAESSVSSEEASSSSSVASSEIESSSSLVASSESNSEASSSDESPESSSSVAESSVASSEESSSSVASSEASSEAMSSSSESSSSTPSVDLWFGASLDLFGSSTSVPQGSISVNTASSITFTAKGGSLNTTNRKFFFAYQDVSGDFVFTARFSSMTVANGGSITVNNNNQFRYGLLITEAITPVANYIDLGRFAELGYYTLTTSPTYQGSRAFKLDVGTGSAQSRSNGAWTIGHYLRISRTGNSIQLSTSTDGVNFTVANTSSFVNVNNNSIATSLKIGFFAAPGVDELMFGFDNISITQN